MGKVNTDIVLEEISLLFPLRLWLSVALHTVLCILVFGRSHIDRTSGWPELS
jgi:hypothetical protein